jgi:hypothetical protein
MSRSKSQSVETPNRADDAASVAAFLRQKRRSGAELSRDMSWTRRRVDRALAELVPIQAKYDVSDNRYFLIAVHDGNLST